MSQKGKTYTRFLSFYAILGVLCIPGPASAVGPLYWSVSSPDKSLTVVITQQRLNSPYLLRGKDRSFFDQLKSELGGLEEGPIDRKKLAKVLLKYDVGSLIHGVFFSSGAKSDRDLAGGRLRIARAISVFIEATGVRVAASGGVKNDHVHPGKVQGDSKNIYGNIIFARDEFTAESIDCHVNIDLAQIRGYGLGEDAERLLTLLALHRLRKLLDGDLRLRTACDLEPVDREKITADRPNNFALPSLAELEKDMPEAIEACKEMMKSDTKVPFEDELKNAKETSETEAAPDDVDAGTDDDIEDKEE